MVVGLVSQPPGIPQSPIDPTIFTPQGVELKIQKPEPDFDQDVLIPLRAHQAKEVEAAREAEQRLAAERQAQAVSKPVYSYQRSYPAPTAYRASQASSGGLTGYIGWARAGGNCVNEPGINNPLTGNPINWAVTSSTPWLGATVLFTWNHTGVVTGIWGNGDVEVRHQNCSGCPSRYSRAMIRGFR